MKIGKTIQYFRKKKNMTQEQMADILGISSAAVSKWETDVTYPDITLLCPVARLLGISVDELLDFQMTLTQEECMRRLKEGERLFLERKAKEAIDYCEELIRQYPTDLFLKFRVGSVYMMYASAVPEETFVKQQLERAVVLLEESTASEKMEIREASYFVLAGLYSANQDMEKALAAVEQLPQPDFDAKMLKSSILYQQGKREEAEKLNQTCLYKEIENAAMNLLSMANSAKTEGDRERALQYIESSIELSRLFHMEGLLVSHHFLKAEILCSLNRPKEAWESLKTLTGYLKKMEGIEGEIQTSVYFNRLSLKYNYGEKYNFLMENMKLMIEQSKEIQKYKEQEELRQIIESL